MGELSASRAAFLLFLAAIAGTRLLELRRARANEAVLRARGGRETGPGLFRAMVALHAAIFVLPVIEVFLLDRRFSPALAVVALAAFAAGTALRYHAILALGRSWSARAIVAPDTPVCEAGLYRWLRHPNYLGVLIEVPAIPLVHGAWISALALGVLNAATIAVRIRQEERALFEIPGYREKMGGKARLIPGIL